MTTKQLKFEDFQVEKITKNQQKKIHGGTTIEEEKDPIRGGGNGNQ